MQRSPFEGQMDLADLAVHQNMDRQEAYQDKIIRNIFKSRGVLNSTLNSLARRVNAGTSGNRLTMDWFNHLAGFPVKLWAGRFHSKRKIDDLLRDMRLPKRLNNAPEVVALEDLQDSYPDYEVACVCKYPDWADDIVFHAIERPIQRTEFQVIRGIEGGLVYRVEYMKPFLCDFTEGWSPTDAEGLYI